MASPVRWVRDRRWLAAILAAAAGIRLVLLTNPILRLDGDEAATGMLARRILEGHHRAFFPGQDYMGSGEQYLQAAVLAVLPDTAFTLRLVPVALAVLACYLTHQVARASGLSPRRALFATAVAAVGPYFALYWGSKSRGAYGTALVLGLAGLLCALWTAPDDRRAVAKVGLFGLVAGGAFWANQQAAYLLVPAAVWILGSVRRGWSAPWRVLAAGAAGFVVGAAPSLWHSLVVGGGIFARLEGTTTVAERASHFVDQTLPDLLGVRDDPDPLFPWLPPAFVVLAAVGALGAAVVHRRAGLLDLVRFRVGERRGVDLFLLVMLVVPLLYVQSGIATEGTSRFVFVVFGMLPLLAAAVPVPGWLRRWIRPTELAVVVVVLVAVHSWVGAHFRIAEADGGGRTFAGQEVITEDLPPVIDALRAAGARTAYADYWVANTVNWLADGDVLVESFNTRRFPHIGEAVDADPSPALIISQSQIGPVSEALDRRGISYTVDRVAGWGVFTAIEPGVHLGITNVAAEELARE